MSSTEHLRRSPQQKRSETTLALIESAARELITENGRDRLTMKAIATRAGLSSPGLYRYFDDVVAILAVVDPINRTVSTVPEIEALKPDAVLRFAGGVFHLSPISGVWLASGLADSYSVEEVAEWAPLTVISDGQ